MCEPVTIGMVAVAVVGTTVSMIAKKQQADYQAKVAAQNAEYSRVAAGQTLLAGQEKETLARIQGGARAGQAQAAFGSSGVMTDSGSTADVLEDTRVMSEWDAQTIRHNAIREAWAHQVGAAGFEAQQSEYESAGKYSLVEGGVKVASNIAGGYADYEKWSIGRGTQARTDSVSD